MHIWRSVLCCLLVIAIMPGAWAKPRPKKVQEPQISTICIDAKTGLIIFEERADMERPPASMVKLVLMLMVAEGVDRGNWALDTPITVSANAEGIGGTQVWLKKDEVFPLRQLMTAVSVASANDAAMAVAEGLWGNKEAYLLAANARVQALGMAHTQINSVHGLPPGKGQTIDHTTARDMATLARECLRHPIILEWTSQKELEFRPGQNKEMSTNKLLWRMKGCDGLKTGYIGLAGFCVTATAQRNGVRLVAVVMGCGSNNDRFVKAEEALEKGFSFRREVFARNHTAHFSPIPLECTMTP